jgi:hypothetical protein
MGTHRELLARPNGRYRMLWEKQMEVCFCVCICVCVCVCACVFGMAAIDSCGNVKWRYANIECTLYFVPYSFISRPHMIFSEFFEGPIVSFQTRYVSLNHLYRISMLVMTTTKQTAPKWRRLRRKSSRIQRKQRRKWWRRR